MSIFSFIMSLISSFTFSIVVVRNSLVTIVLNLLLDLQLLPFYSVTEAVDGNKTKDSDSNKRKLQDRGSTSDDQSFEVNIFLFKCSFCSFLSFIVFKQHTDLSHNVFLGKKRYLNMTFRTIFLATLNYVPVNTNQNTVSSIYKPFKFCNNLSSR
jgi:hypothetical protein